MTNIKMRSLLLNPAFHWTIRGEKKVIFLHFIIVWFLLRCCRLMYNFKLWSCPLTNYMCISISCFICRLYNLFLSIRMCAQVLGHYVVILSSKFFFENVKNMVFIAQDTYLSGVRGICAKKIERESCKEIRQLLSKSDRPSKWSTVRAYLCSLDFFFVRDK